jgi:hypothetical protein
VFHFRGSIDYKKISFVHRGMMAMLKKMTVDKKNPDEWTADDKLLVNTYGGKVDFTDRTTIEALVEHVRELMEKQEDNHNAD